MPGKNSGPDLSLVSDLGETVQAATDVIAATAAMIRLELVVIQIDRLAEDVIRIGGGEFGEVPGLDVKLAKTLGELRSVTAAVRQVKDHLAARVATI